MDTTTTTAWLIGLSVVTGALIVLVALDLKRQWSRPTEERVRMLVARALQTAEVEAATSPRGVPVQRDGRAEPERPPAGAAGASMFDAVTPPITRYPRPSDILAPPPMIGDDTLRDWLVHYRKDREVWQQVVEEFYARAAQVPAVADYFVGVDWPRLKNHFLAALLIITHTGVTRAMPATMSARHATVRNSNGDPITEDIFTGVINTLVDVLRDVDVPDDALNQLGRTVAPFRAALVRKPKDPTS
jgi:truncated hemoglobin YjbI